MSEARYGEEFVKHEFDEAIAIQQSIVEAERKLSTAHPHVDSKNAIKAVMKDDERFLRELQQLGRQHGATGVKEEVAGSLDELMKTTAEHATEAESEAYEAHAVLLNLKRKQQDSAVAMVKIARAMKDTKMHDAAQQFAKSTKTAAQDLADNLAAFAVEIATEGRTNGGSSSRGGSARSRSGGSRSGGSRSGSRPRA